MCCTCLSVVHQCTASASRGTGNWDCNLGDWTRIRLLLWPSVTQWCFLWCHCHWIVKRGELVVVSGSYQGTSWYGSLNWSKDFLVDSVMCPQYDTTTTYVRTYNIECINVYNGCWVLTISIWQWAISIVHSAYFTTHWVWYSAWCSMWEISGFGMYFSSLLLCVSLVLHTVVSEHSLSSAQ